MTGRNRLPTRRWRGAPASQSQPTAASMSSSSSAIQSNAAPTAAPTIAPTAAPTVAPAPISIPSTIAPATVSVPPTSTTPAPVAVTTVGPLPSISASTEGGDAYTSRRVRIYVQSDRFVPNGHAISKFITEKMKERQYKEGYTWSKIDKHTHDFYWREFKKKYYWPPEEEETIKTVWEKVSRCQYSRNLCRWHKYYEETSKKPVWVEDEVWNKWLEYWNKDEFKHKSRQASNNRRSETGGEGSGMSRHLGGSKSFVEHAIDLRKSLQKPPTAFDIFCKTHISKEGKGVDSRAQAVYDAMQKMVENVSQPLSDGSQPSSPNMDAIYLEASGGEKKRRVYGLGSQASSLYPDSFCSGATSAPPPPSAATIPPEIVSEMDGMKKKMVELEQQNQNLIQQNQRMCKQMRREWRQMRMMMQSGLLPSGPGQSSQHQEQDEEQDEDDDDDDDDDDVGLDL